MTPQTDLFVTDTHSLAWYLEDNPRLSQGARLAFASINAGDKTGIIPTIVLAELMHISERRRVDLDFNTIVMRFRNSMNFRFMSLDFNILMQMRQFPTFELHDRIIVATALSIGAHLITRDVDIRNAGVVECIW